MRQRPRIDKERFTISTCTESSPAFKVAKSVHHKHVFDTFTAEEAVQSKVFQDIIANSQSWFKDINDKSWQKDMKIGNTAMTVKLDEYVTLSYILYHLPD